MFKKSKNQTIFDVFCVIKSINNYINVNKSLHDIEEEFFDGEALKKHLIELGVDIYTPIYDQLKKEGGID